MSENKSTNINKRVINNKKLKNILFLLISFFIIEVNRYVNFCFNCINKITNNNCLKCSNACIFKDIQIYSDEVTLNEIINKNKSITRIGDGEFFLINGKGIRFQDYNRNLSQRLLKILNSEEKNLLVGINLPYKKSFFNRFNEKTKIFYNSYFNKYRFILAQIIKKRKFFSAWISRFYMAYKSKKKVPRYIKHLKKIWDKKDIIIIEGKYSRLGIGNNLFDNVKSIQRIICPIKNAFNKYEEILNITKKIVPKNKLILIALGPSATLLAYDLSKLGFQSIDIGHVDIEYEWYLRKTKTKIPIKNKYVSEVLKNNELSINITDKNYYKQIIGIITD